MSDNIALTVIGSISSPLEMAFNPYTALFICFNQAHQIEPDEQN